MEPRKHLFSEDVVACYEAIAAAVTAFDRGKRWEIPVPSAEHAPCEARRGLSSK